MRVTTPHTERESRFGGPQKQIGADLSAPTFQQLPATGQLMFILICSS